MDIFCDIINKYFALYLSPHAKVAKQRHWFCGVGKGTINFLHIFTVPVQFRRCWNCYIFSFRRCWTAIYLLVFKIILVADLLNNRFNFSQFTENMSNTYVWFSINLKPILWNCRPRHWNFIILLNIYINHGHKAQQIPTTHYTPFPLSKLCYHVHVLICSQMWFMTNVLTNVQ